jgi:CheY-like chemotaxis protein
VAVIAPEPGSTRTQPRAGGTIAAGSEGPGTGATFVVSLPVQIATRHAVDSEPAFAAPGVRRLAGLRVVVVDDEPDARDVTKAILASEGAEVVTAASAGDALHAISGEGLDALVADIGMPERDGYWLIRAVRSLPASDGGAIPAVALTAWTAPKDRDGRSRPDTTAISANPSIPTRSWRPCQRWRRERSRSAEFPGQYERPFRCPPCPNTTRVLVYGR